MTLVIQNKTITLWEQLDAILGTIQAVQTRLGALRFKSPAYIRQIRALERVVFAYRGTQDEIRILGDPRFPEYARRIRRLYDEYEVHDEYKTRRQLIETMGNFVQPSSDLGALLDISPPIQRTYTYTFAEAAGAMLAKGAVYCHIGCGSFPETLLAISSYTKGSVRLTGIDFDACALQNAAAFTRIVLSGPTLHFIQAAGEDVDYSPFTHIHLAVLVRPEPKVVKRVCETAAVNHEVVLMLRSAAGIASLVYEPLCRESEQLLAAHGFMPDHTVRGHAIMQTNIYRRK